MKEIPILFNGEMVRAILEGRKTQTRRPVTPLPPDGIDELHGNDLRSRAPYDCECNETGRTIGYGFQDEDGRVYKCPFGCIGDRLWVRETFAGYIQTSHEYDEWREATTEEVQEQYPMTVEYCATSQSHPDKWRPSIHMPRWASRIMLEVTDIRVQRVQEISEEDAIAEGCPIESPQPFVKGYGSASASGWFSELWNKVYNTWEANPWVWVATFKKAEAAQ